MPIYEYRCAACGFQKEYLQKMSDAPLTDCPECGKPRLAKMVTAAGFQLKGSGWYVTDFRQGAKPQATGAAAAKSDAATGGAAEAKTDAGAAKPAAEAPAKKADAPAASTAGTASSSNTPAGS
jgi:putative FmdB family regulatory protein